MDRRSKFKQGLCSLYLPYYEALCDELPEEWQPYSGYRTFDEQNNLWAKGRSLHGDIVTDAKGGESAHNWGCATDWIIWKDNNPVWIPREDKRWDEYIKAVENVGLKSGKDFGDVDHNELKISCGWKKILAFYDREGSISAYQQIEDAIMQ